MAKSEGGARATRWPLVRLAVYLLALLATVVLATIATRLLVPPAPSPWHDLVWIKNVALPVALFIIYGGLVRLMERRPAHELSVAKGVPGFVSGIVVGAGVIGAAFFTLQALGMARLSAATGLEGLGLALLFPMITAMIEELLFRVILFGILQEITGSLVAILISSAVFGLAHAGNPGAGPFALAALSVELGVMLSLAYILTRNVWLIVAIHAAWNFMQAFVLGAENSGVRDPHSYFEAHFSGPDLFTGGAFGLEGSVVTLGWSLLVSGVLFVLVLRKHAWLGARFHLGAPQVEV